MSHATPTAPGGHERPGEPGAQRITQSGKPAQQPSEPTPEPPDTAKRENPEASEVPPAAQKDLPETQYGKADPMEKPKT